MLFRQRVSFQGALNVRQRACGEMAAHNAPTNAYNGAMSMRQSGPLVFSSPREAVDHANRHTFPALSPPRDCRWKRGRPVTFSNRTFSTKQVESTPHVGDAAVGPKSSVAQKQATGQQEPGTDCAGTMDALHQGILAERSTCAVEHDHTTTTQYDCTPAENASSEEDRITNPLNPSSTKTQSTTLSTKDLDYPGVPSQVQPSLTTISVMDAATDTDYLPTSTDEIVNESEDITTETAEADQEATEIHTPLEFQIPEDVLRAAMTAPESSKASFWSNTLYRGPEGKKILVHYCKTKEISERVAQHFVNEKVLGFDIEWKPWAHPESIKKNVSLIQLACEDRIALFHVARFTGTTAPQLMPPTLKAILESPDVYKVGVAVKGDFTRLNKFLEVEPQGVFELSRLHNLVQFTGTEIKITNKLVGLAAQVHQHLQLPLYKGGQLIDDPEDLSNVRSSDWSLELNVQQIHYAAADAYAGFRLYDILEEKRKKLKPTPSRPLVCDYDSKPAPKSDKPKKKRKATAKVDDVAMAVAEEAAAPVGQEQQQEAEGEVDEEPKGTQETEGYETAQEELIDSYQLEGEEPESSQESYEATSESEDDISVDLVPHAKEERTVAGTDPSQKRVGRFNLGRLKGLDPGYPTLPDLRGGEEAHISSDEDLVGMETSDDMETSEEEEADDSNVSIEVIEKISESDSDSDEFGDSELEEALNELIIDGSGRLQEDVAIATSSEPRAMPEQPYSAPGSGHEAKQVEVAEDLCVQDSQSAKDHQHVEPAATEPAAIEADDASNEEEQHLIDLLNDPEIIDYLHSPTQPSVAAQPPPTEPSTAQSYTPATDPAQEESTHAPEFNLATAWARTYLASTIPSPTPLTPSHIRATIPHLRAYNMWHHQELSLSEIAQHLRDPPLSEATVGSYVLQAIVLERMEYDAEAVRGVLMNMPEALRRGKWRGLAEKVGAR